MDIIDAVAEWLKHCEEAGHVPRSEGGKAHYTYSQATGRIFCNAKGCAWEASEIGLRQGGGAA